MFSVRVQVCAHGGFGGKKLTASTRSEQQQPVELTPEEQVFERRREMLRLLYNSGHKNLQTEMLSALFLQDPAAQNFDKEHHEEVAKVRANLDKYDAVPFHLVPDDLIAPHLIAFFNLRLLPLIPENVRVAAYISEAFFVIAMANVPIPAFQMAEQPKIQVSRWQMARDLANAIEEKKMDEADELIRRLGGPDHIKTHVLPWLDNDYASSVIVATHYSQKRRR